MILNRKTLAAMKYLAANGWTLREFADAFEGGNIQNVDPLVFADCGYVGDVAVSCEECCRKQRDRVFRDGNTLGCVGGFEGEIR